ncbi:MAG: hypothetical protein KF685_07830 [Acidobacteria bacterium]|nr:hypothetical protein [Acidobacteriota bacterium]
MLDHWSYEKQKRFDRQGNRWHFVIRTFLSTPVGRDEPREIYFRSDDRLQFGVIRYERYQDNPYRDYEILVNKIMNNDVFRKPLLNPDTEAVWLKSWK